MLADIYQKILDGIPTLHASEDVKREFERMVREAAVNDGVSCFVQEDRVYFARRLLDAREPRNVIRDRLMRRYRIKESQAYMDIARALQIVQKPPIKMDE